MASLFTDLTANIDAGIASSFGSAAAGMSAYVLPIGWTMFGITLLVYAVMVIEGKTNSPMKDWMVKGIGLLLILTATGTMYSSWVSGPLFALPNELATAVSGAPTSTAALDTLSDSLDQMIMGLAQAMVSAFAGLNIGGGFILLVCIGFVSIAGSLLEISCVFNMIYAKIGLAMVLAVGPFFVVMLLWQQTKGYFFSWFNTVLYFVFLTVMSTMVMVLFITIANKFMGKLSDAVAASTGAQQALGNNILALLKSYMSGEVATTTAVSAQPVLNILSISIQMVMVFLPMFFVALEMRTLVSSMTGGSGGSFGSGAVNLFKSLKGGG
jgi:type IV secretion system protein VirB6